MHAALNLASAHDHQSSRGSREAVEGLVGSFDLVTISERSLVTLHGRAVGSLDLHSVAQLWLGLGARLVVVTLAAGGAAVFRPTAGSGIYNPNIIGGGVTKVEVSLTGSGAPPGRGWPVDLLRQLRAVSAGQQLQRDSLAALSDDTLRSAITASLTLTDLDRAAYERNGFLLVCLR